jgi:carbonic anhydrase/acetyltransferase-like protein (isoleucine patch superfamily)
LSSHVCIAGFSEVGQRSFIGINASVIDYVIVAEDCFIAAGAMVNKNTEINSIYMGNPAEKNSKVTAKKYFKVK